MFKREVKLISCNCVNEDDGFTYRTLIFQGVGIRLEMQRTTEDLKYEIGKKYIIVCEE